MTTNNIYDTANQLEKDIRELPVFKQLQEAYAEIQEDETSSKLFEQFRETSQNLQMKQAQNVEIDEEEISTLQALFMEVSNNQAISKLMASEQQLSQVIEDINKVIIKPLNELYQSGN